MIKVLVTGGAGFIGSNIVDRLIADERVCKVRVLDNLATGRIDNVNCFLSEEKYEFIEGDIRNYETCLEATNGMDYVLHQAALGSVPRSIKDPLLTNAVNIEGTLNVFQAVINSSVKRIVFAASSSTYGDSKELPKVEGEIGSPLSPYAVTKLVNEIYAETLAKCYDFEYVALRYFNVFGPRQDPRGSYAAVIPLFMKSAVLNSPPIINGNGEFSRDFTFISNVVDANLLAMFSENEESVNQVYNVACGSKTSLLELWEKIKKVSKSSVDPIMGPTRAGDIPHSLADISKARKLLGYDPAIGVDDGIIHSFNWYKSNMKRLLE